MIYFIIKYNTNLGNWLFQYAAALNTDLPVGIVLEKKEAAAQLNEYKDLFGGLKVISTEEAAKLSVYKEPEFRYHPLPVFNGDVVLDGFFQSEKFFDKDDILKRFGLTKEREAYLRSKYGDWLSRPNVTGISVRYGKDYQSQSMMHPFVGRAYFKQTIRMLPECRDFIVCSDNMAWCKGWFPKTFPDKNFLFAEGESVLDQLYLHTLCQNNILSNSSFSWWGGWLNTHHGKKVFAPSMWFGPFARYIKTDWRDIYPKGCIVIKNRPTLNEWFQMHVRCLWKILRIEGVKLRRKVSNEFMHNGGKK